MNNLPYFIKNKYSNKNLNKKIYKKMSESQLWHCNICDKTIKF